VVKLKTNWRKRQYVERYWKGEKEEHKAKRDYERRKKMRQYRQTVSVDNEQINSEEK
jgi:hypothetical protein